MAVFGLLRRVRAIHVAMFAALAVLAGVGPAAAQGGSPDLEVSFQSISLPAAMEVTPQAAELIGAGGSTKYAAINANVLMDDLQSAETVSLELFDGVAFSLSVTASRDGVAGSRFWSATGDGVDASFTELNGVIQARIAHYARNELYRIVGVADGVHLIVDDNVAYPSELGLPTPEVDDSGSATGQAGDISSNAGPQVDVLAWYDDDAIAFWGSAGNAETAIAAAYNNFNDAADRSGALVMLNVVELTSVSWTAPVSAVDAVVAIRSQTDGIMDEVHAARDAAGADLVAVIGDLTGGCGIAYVPQSPPSAARADLGFSYTDAACVGGNLTLVHETGHNFGPSHDIGASQPGPGLYPYSQGYVNPALGYRTIMSYTTACGGCLRVAHFSSPTALYNGNPTGDPGKDNARTITESAAGVASYRTSGDSADPDAAITDPAQNAAATGDPITLAGTASDDIGVTRVRLTIYETGGYTTWNGSAFTAAFSTVDAVLNPPGGALTAWSYDMSGPPDAQVVFTALAYDAVGKTDGTPPWRLFNISNDSTAPDGLIDTPTSGDSVSGSPVQLGGTATDNVGISRVRLTIYDQNGFATWNGSAFTAPFTTVDAVITGTGGNVTWDYDMISPPDADVVFTALAYDLAGNIDPTKPWRVFSIDSSADTVAPNGLIDNPTQNEQVTDPTITLDGTATDNVGVNRVRLTIYNTANNHTWDGAAFTAAFTTVEAVVTPSGSNATWAYDMVNPPVETQVVFTALAYDTSNNIDPSQPWRLFEIAPS